MPEAPVIAYLLFPMASKRSQDKEDIHYRVLRLLQEHPDLSQRELAEKLNVSNGSIHYCLNALLDKGLIKIGNFAASRHKLGYAYLLTPEGIARKAVLASQFLQRKMAEYEALKAELEALRQEVDEAGELERAEASR